MSDIVIRAENLGKEYTIGHRSDPARYLTLREVLMRSARESWSKTKDLLQGKPIVLGNTYEEFWALKDVSFEIHRGDALGIIGRNGAGKSTLLKLLSRITDLSSGRVTIRGRVASLLEVGTGFHPELSGRENIYLNGAILGMTRSEIRRKFEEIVAFAEVERFLDTPVKRFSSGMYVRLAFAVAAHLEPEILVVDEVLAVGDAAFQKKCLGKMGAVASEGRTVIFVSHNMGAINRLCRSVLWLDKGVIVGCGNTADIVAKYVNDNSCENGFCEWPGGIANPGTDELRLYGMRIHGPDGAISSTVDARYPFKISFEYEVEKPLPHCRIGFVLATADGTVVFDSYDSDLESLQGPRGVGAYTLWCEIPGHLLLPGQYLLSFNAGMPGVKNLIWLENILSVTVEDTQMIGEISAQPAGIIRPRLNWERFAR